MRAGPFRNFDKVAYRFSLPPQGARARKIGTGISNNAQQKDGYDRKFLGFCWTSIKFLSKGTVNKNFRERGNSEPTTK
jgi:hypothetical protein